VTASLLIPRNSSPEFAAGWRAGVRGELAFGEGLPEVDALERLVGAI